MMSPRHPPALLPYPRTGFGRMPLPRDVPLRGPRRNAGNTPSLVQGNVQDEVRSRLSGDIEHFLMDRIAVDVAPTAPGCPIASGRGAPSRLECTDAGHDCLSAAGESRHEVGLDEAGKDAQFRPEILPVDMDRRFVERRFAQVFMGGEVTAAVVDMR